MAPFYGWGSTASRLEPLRGGSLLFTTKFPEISWYSFYRPQEDERLMEMELFAVIGNGRAYNQWAVVFVCCCGNSTIFTGKIRIR